VADENDPSGTTATERSSSRGVVLPTFALGDAWVIVELAPDAVLVVDEQGQIELANRAAVEMFGYEREAMFSLNVDLLVPDGRRERHRGHRAQFSSSPQTRPMGLGMNLWARRADGSEFPVEISLSPVTFGQGSRVVTVVRDLTEHVVSGQVKQAHEAEPAQSTPITSAVFDSVVNSLFMIGLNLHRLSNRAPSGISEQLDELIDEVDEAIREVRFAAYSVSLPRGRSSEGESRNRPG